MLKKIASIHSLQPTQKVSRGSRKNGAPQENTGDNLEVSSFAKELSRAMGELQRAPLMRQEKVMSLRQQIEEGTYQPKLSVVALALLGASHILPHEEA